MRQGRILIIEDEPSMRLGMSHFLSSTGYAVKVCSDGEEGLKAIEEGAFDLVISDLRLPKVDGLALLRRSREVLPSAGVIIITGFADVKTAVEAMKEGAFDYIAKPFSNEELLITVERFLTFRNLEREVVRLRESADEKTALAHLVGVSRPLRDVFDRICSVADTDVPVLIQGESGTGKELVADAIHALSGRKAGRWLKINCAAIPETLFESELFGHERGAFTGASELRKGKFESAEGGSIFFDEIAEMPLGLQAKLLRVIEERSVTRLGGHGSIRVDVRGIYATSKNLKELIRQGRFREDLFYRINVVPIVLPPLRERREDVPHLVRHFLSVFGEKYGKPGVAFGPNALEALLLYDYPGNVRELKHAVEHAVLLCKDGLVRLSELPEELQSGKVREAGCLPAGDATLRSGVSLVERQLIIDALRDAKGKRIEAARRLGITRKVLWKRMKDYGIETFPEGNV